MVALAGPGREPMAIGRRGRLAAGLDGNVGGWRGRGAQLRRIRLDRCAGLRGDHGGSDVVDAARLEACGRSKEESQVTDNNELHVVFGTGPVGMAVMDELVSKGRYRCLWYRG